MKVTQNFGNPTLNNQNYYVENGGSAVKTQNNLENINMTNTRTEGTVPNNLNIKTVEDTNIRKRGDKSTDLQNYKIRNTTAQQKRQIDKNNKTIAEKSEIVTKIKNLVSQKNELKKDELFIKKSEKLNLKKTDHTKITQNQKNKAMEKQIYGKNETDVCKNDFDENLINEQKDLFDDFVNSPTNKPKLIQNKNISNNRQLLKNDQNKFRLKVSQNNQSRLISYPKNINSERIQNSIQFPSLGLLLPLKSKLDPSEKSNSLLVLPSIKQVENSHEVKVKNEHQTSNNESFVDYFDEFFGQLECRDKMIKIEPNFLNFGCIDTGSLHKTYSEDLIFTNQFDVSEISVQLFFDSN